MALTWADFEQALASVFARFEDGSRLILTSREEEDYYLQAAINAGQPLYLEAVGDQFLDDGVKLGADGAARLSALGWQPPRDDPGNWWVEVPWPGTTAQLTAAAQLVGRTLREVYGATDAQELYYTAFRESGSEPLEFDGLGIERVDP